MAKCATHTFHYQVGYFAGVLVDQYVLPCVFCEGRISNGVLVLALHDKTDTLFSRMF